MPSLWSGEVPRGYYTSPTRKGSRRGASEERRVKVGRTSYTAYFAILKDGKAAELFTEGQYPQQAQLKDAISAAAGKPWVTAQPKSSSG